VSYRPFAWIAGLTVGIAAVGIAAIVVFIGTGVSESVGARGPTVGEHWHAVYQVTICGAIHPPAPTWEGSGVHTHQDGIIHSHPFTDSEAGEGARLIKWFEYGGGVLSGNELRVPGFPATYANGAQCPDGAIGFIQVLVNGQVVDLETYIPQDGDQVEIIFGPKR
jgi:hypothetical protein